MVKLHKIKILEEFADSVLFGDKTFEIRKNDRGYQRGDLVRFIVMGKQDNTNVRNVYPCDRKPIEHPLNKETYKITYVLNGWGLDMNMVAFSIVNVTGEMVGQKNE